MKSINGCGSFSTVWGKWLKWAAVSSLGLALCGITADLRAQRPSTDRHVSELATYLDHVQIAEPASYRQLEVYPILLEGGSRLRGHWLTLDAALSRNVLVITEKSGGGSVPAVMAENRSRDEHVFIMTGEIISGGKQTRTVRQDVILSPGQKLELSVFCVEARRWEGDKEFNSNKVLLPQSMQSAIRGGAGQGGVWSDIGAMGKALNAENSTDNLEKMLKSREVDDKLGEVRRAIGPRIPEGTVGFIFVDRGRALGGEFLGNETMARDLFPKLLDSYAVDYVILRKDTPPRGVKSDNRVAIDFFEKICRTGSDRAGTPGSGSGIRTRGSGLSGEGVSQDGALLHYGAQSEDRTTPRPTNPPIIYPEPR
jgi:hypothetical protein